MPPAPESPAPAANASESLRVHQANERTLLAWIRTGISLMVFGFAVARFGMFLRELAPAARDTAHRAQSLGSAWFGVALVSIGFLVNAAATVHFRVVRRNIEQGRVGTPSAALVYALGALIALVGGTMIVLLVKSIPA